MKKRRALLRVVVLYLTGLEVEVVVPNLKVDPDQLDHWHIVTNEEKEQMQACEYAWPVCRSHPALIKRNRDLGYSNIHGRVAGGLHQLDSETQQTSRF